MAYIPYGRLNGKRGEVNDKIYLRCQLVLNVINQYFETSTEVLIRKSRKREIVWPRQVAMYFLAYYTAMPLRGIGVMLGGKDHTTVIHAIQLVNDLQQSDSKVKEQIHELTDKFDALVKWEQEIIRNAEDDYRGHA